MASEETTLQTTVQSYNEKLDTINTNINKVVQTLNALNLYNIVGSIDTIGELTEYGINDGYVYNGPTITYHDQEITQGQIFIRTGSDTFTIIPVDEGITYYPSIDSTTSKLSYSNASTDRNTDMTLTIDYQSVGLDDVLEITSDNLATNTFKKIDHFPIVHVYIKTEDEIYEEVDVDYTITYDSTNKTYSLSFTDTTSGYMAVIR